MKLKDWGRVVKSLRKQTFDAVSKIHPMLLLLPARDLTADACKNK
jgi:hypothetical protein